MTKHIFLLSIFLLSFSGWANSSVEIKKEGERNLAGFLGRDPFHDQTYLQKLICIRLYNDIAITADCFVSC